MGEKSRLSLLLVLVLPTLTLAQVTSRLPNYVFRPGRNDDPFRSNDPFRNGGDSFRNGDDPFRNDDDPFRNDDGFRQAKQSCVDGRICAACADLSGDEVACCAGGVAYSRCKHLVNFHIRSRSNDPFRDGGDSFRNGDDPFRNKNGFRQAKQECVDDSVCSQCAELTGSGDDGKADCCAGGNEYRTCQQIVNFGPPGRQDCAPDSVCSQCAELTGSGDDGKADCCAGGNAYSTCQQIVNFGPPGRMNLTPPPFIAPPISNGRQGPCHNPNCP